jgi:hypothetical protein
MRLASVDATPTAVSPGQVPDCASGSCLRHVVDAGRAQGMTAQQACQRHPSSAPQAEAFDRFIGIDRAGRQMSAVVTDQRRQGVPVDPDQRTSCIARQMLRGMPAIATSESMEQRAFHRRLASPLHRHLCGSRLRNQNFVFLRHIFKNIAWSTALQQRSCGRSGIVPLRF